MSSKKKKPANPLDKIASQLPTAPLIGTCPLVGIGASAGGLEAFEAFFRACPANSGIAFILVPHLDPAHDSLMTEILQRCTVMPVVQALDLVAVEPNHVYIIPPNREMAILHGALQLSVPDAARGHRMPIDAFFCSLAADQANHAIGIVLSGTASDGTLGLGAIQAAGGVCMVQEPTSAKYDGMPQSAITAGYATHILPVEQMPAMLLQLISQTGYRQRLPVIPAEKTTGGLNKVLLQLRASLGHDFSLYKKSTIGRRIARRMAQHGIEDELAYARFLKENPAEVQLLFTELLINVTRFFRDPEAFIALKQTILPALLIGKPPGYVFRVWVAACSSGEEAYSIAILLRELQSELPALQEQDVSVLIYATDLDDDAIATARAGHYPLHIAQDVTPERLRRFFIKDATGYKIKKDIRDTVVFAVQNVIKDPPFTKLDVLSCRNLMIYLEPELQTRLISTFHYALKPQGVLFLSTSESIPSQPELFTSLDRKWKLYQARHANIAASFAMANTIAANTHFPIIHPSAATIMPTLKPASIADISHHALLAAYAPASVTIDAAGNILYIHGDTGRYLRPAPGLASNNVLEMAREGLQPALRSAFLQVVALAAPLLSEEVSVKTNGGFSLVRFSLQRLSERLGGENVFLLSFRDIAAPEHTDAAALEHSDVELDLDANTAKGSRKPKGAALSELDLARIKELERKLDYADEAFKTHSEEQQTFYEELKSSNEELQSTNEELQSANEELETSKEELQSLNEETITVNSELSARIEQLTSMQNDMKNLLDSIGTGTLFLDHALCIRRHTPAAAKIYRLIASDVGRPLSDITSSLELSQQQSLYAELQRVLDTLIPIEHEVQTLDGEWYLARIQPYRTLDNVIEGVVLTFTSITEFKRSKQAAQELALTEHAATQLARELAEAIVNMVREPLLVLDGLLQVVSASRSFYAQFQVTAEETLGCKIYELGNHQWDIPTLRELLEKVLPQNQTIENYGVEHNFPHIGQRSVMLNARRIVTTVGNTELILLALRLNDPAAAAANPLVNPETIPAIKSLEGAP